MIGTMARKPVAREAVLDAFESLLIDVGERAATLDAVARRAGVSKGGLLYHFPNKEAMISALLERLDRLLAEDVEAMAAAPEGAAAYFIKSSVWAAPRWTGCSWPPPGWPKWRMRRPCGAMPPARRAGWRCSRPMWVRPWPSPCSGWATGCTSTPCWPAGPAGQLPDVGR